MIIHPFASCFCASKAAFCLKQAALSSKQDMNGCDVMAFSYGRYKRQRQCRGLENCCS